MVILYYLDNGEIKNFYTGNTSQIGWYYANDESMIFKIGEAILEDDISIMMNPHDYRAILKNKNFVEIAKKIEVILERKENKLIVSLENLHDSDDIDSIKIPILIGNKELELSPGEYNIDFNSNSPVMIEVNDNFYKSKPFIWEVGE